MDTTLNQPTEPDDAEIARREALAERVEALGNSLCKKRQEAISGRKNSGIEDEWSLAEDAYQGIDDANRGTATVGKPSSPNGGITSGQPVPVGTRSTIVLNITRPYVDAAAARVSDMLLPTDDTPWGIKPTPMPTLVTPEPPAEAPAAPPGVPAMPTMGVMPGGPGVPTGMPPGMPPGAGGPPGMPGAPGMPPGMPGGQPPMPMNPLAMAMEAAAKEQARAKQAAELATKEIEDWLVQCQWHAEVRKMIEDTARLGTGVLKGPVPALRRHKAITMEAGVATVRVEKNIVPESRAIDPWNFYPDPACGESIHDGSYVWECDTITRRGLRDLKEVDGGYLGWQIDKVLEEGPQSSGSDGDGYAKPFDSKKDSDVFTIWYFYGTAEREDLEAAGVKGLPEGGDVSAHAIITMVNSRVIKAAINPLDSGEFPYDVMVWQRRPGVPYGTGVAMQINVPQRMLTGGVRNLMDNAGLSAGPQIVARRGALVPANGKWEITPRKVWFVAEDSDVAAVDKAFQIFNIPTMQAELQNIIQFALKMAEDVTGLPAMMQGQNTHAPDTVGGMQMLQNNAGTVLRRIARLFDDRVTEPHIRRYYEWLMIHGESDAAKGDFQIDARGSTALVERDLQNQSIAQMGPLVTNPAFGLDPEKWLGEMLRSQRLDPKRFQMDEEKKAAMANQPPPVAPQIEVAKIRAETEAQKTQAVIQKDLQIAQIEAQADTERARLDTDRDAIYVQSQANRDQIAAEAKQQELMLKRDELLIKRELAMLEYANANKVTLDKIKADLAKKAMEINATKELAGMQARADQMPKPPVEPPGRAPAGESFTK